MKDADVILNGAEVFIAHKTYNYGDQIRLILTDLKGNECLNELLSPCSLLCPHSQWYIQSGAFLCYIIVTNDENEDDAQTVKLEVI